MIDWHQLILLLPVGVILLAALVVVGCDLCLPRRFRPALPVLALAGCVAGLFSIGLTASVLKAHTTWFFDYAQAAENVSVPVILGGAFCVDGFGLFIWGLACLAGVLSIMCAQEPSEESALSTGEYYGLVLLAVSGMMLLGVAHDFLTLLISLEIMSVATYILSGSRKTDLKSNEAALKYLILGAFSTSFMLLGIAFYYGALGSLSLAPIASGGQPLVTLGLGLLLIGVLFKIGAAPFQFWIPDVYQGAPTAVTGLMAFGVKAAAFAVVARLAFETFGAPQWRVLWLPLLQALAVLTMIVGNLLAMRQTNVKRLLAYSAIAHTGYLLLAFLVPADSGPEALGAHLNSVVFYLLVYGLATVGAFGVVSLAREDGRNMEELESFTGLARAHPGLALSMAVFMLSLAGLPPLGGFFAKFLIFRDALACGQVIPAVLGILTSVASLYYYLRVVVAMYMSADKRIPETPAVLCKTGLIAQTMICGASLLTVVIGLFPGLLAR